jgi:hypothetical protein
MLNTKYEKVMGRPKIGTEKARGVFIAARFTPVEAKQIHSAINQSRQTKSDWIRKNLLSASAASKMEQRNENS